MEIQYVFYVLYNENHINDSFFFHCSQEKSQKQTLIQPFGAM